MEYPDISTRVKKLRSSKRISQFRLEIAAGFCPGVISKIENKHNSPTKETLRKIACALKLNLSECAFLFGLDTFTNPTQDQ